jgi:ABC-type sugar transport system permease subunit
MLLEILVGIQPILVKMILAMLTIIIPIIAKLVIDFVKLKLNELQTRVGEQNYTVLKKIAEETYFIIEQKFINGMIQDKEDAFNNLLKQKLPQLSQDEIDDFREAICGEINTYLKQK